MTSMSERPPNEVSAAPVADKLREDAEGHDALGNHATATILRGYAASVDRLTLDLAQARRERDANASRAEKAERELSEARAAKAKAEGMSVRWQAEAQQETRERDTWKARAEAAESSLREHAEAIVVLRAVAQFVIDYQEMPVDEFQNTYRDYEVCGDHAFQDYAAKLSRAALENELASRLSVRQGGNVTPEERAIKFYTAYCHDISGWEDDVNKLKSRFIEMLASCFREVSLQVERERRAERDVVIPWDERLPCDVTVAPCTIIRKGCALRTLFAALAARGMILPEPAALAALPASDGEAGVIDKTDSDVTG